MQHYWFKAKTYGWGWYPSSWQGWVTVGMYVIYMVYRAQAMTTMFDTASSAVFRYFFELMIPTAILLLVCYKTGERPYWRWGDKQK